MNFRLKPLDEVPSAGGALPLAATEQPPTSTISVTVVVPTYRRGDQLRECLTGLANQLHAPNQVVVVARADDDETLRTLAACADSLLSFDTVLVTEPGMTHACNAGAAHARGDVVAYIDDDAVAKPDWLLRLVEPYSDPRVGAVGGKMIVPRLSSAKSSAKLRIGSPSVLGSPVGNHHLGDGESRDVTWLRGANMSFRRELCRFDESLRGSGAQVANDSEISLRVHAAGWRVVYVPSAAVFHYAAPRPGPDSRSRPSGQVVRDAAFNELLVLLRWLDGPSSVRVGAYLLLVGTPPAPGPIGAVRAVLSGRRRPLDALTNCVHATLARIQAIAHRAGGRDREDRAPDAPRA